MRKGTKGGSVLNHEGKACRIDLWPKGGGVSPQSPVG